MPRRRALTIDYRTRAEELRAEVRLLEAMGDVERAAWLQEIADIFEELVSRQSVGNIRQPVSRVGIQPALETLPAAARPAWRGRS